MIFTPATEGYAKSLARSLRDELGQHGFKASHSESLETLSRMFGHAGWIVMQKSIRSGKRPSLFDQDLPPKEMSARRAQEVSAICSLGVEASVARSVAATLDASNRGGSRKSHFTDRIRFLVDTGGMEDAEPVAYEGLYRDDCEVFDLVTELSASDLRWRHVAAIALLSGHGASKDPARASEILQELLTTDIADRRKGFVASTLGDIAGGKHGLPKDERKELQYYRLAALTYDHPTAAFNLGLHYRNATPPNLVAAADMFALALREGSVEAATNFGLLMIRNGMRREGVDPFVILKVASSPGDGIATTAFEQFSRTDIEAAYRIGEPVDQSPE